MLTELLDLRVLACDSNWHALIKLLDFFSNLADVYLIGIRDGMTLGSGVAR